MSDPTYRIDVSHKPMNEYAKWVATVVRVGDDRMLEARSGLTSDEALRSAQDWIAAEEGKQSGFSVYTDDNGRLVEGHSVKA